jgi:predicted dehydrogenase
MAAIPIGVIGAGGHAQELLRHAAPLAELRVAHCAPAPDDVDSNPAIEFARRFGAAFSPEWRVVAEDRQVPAVLVLGEMAGRTEIIVAALNAGKVVLCPFPAARDAAALAEVANARTKGHGILLTLGEIAGTAAGADALGSLREGRLGTLHSIWAAVRSRRTDAAGQGVVEQHGWPVLDFLLAAVHEPVARVHATLATLFEPGPHEDTAVILLRFEQGPVATVELARCLPPSMAVPTMGEVEIEAIGAREVVRIEPYNSAVRVYADTGVSTRPWVDGALVRSLPQVVAAVRTGAADESCLERNGRAIAVMDMIGSTRVVRFG